MGNNAAFSSFEKTVLAVYNKGVLDKELLSALMEPYRDVDIDSGGMAGTLSKNDKLDIVDIVIKTFGKTPPEAPKLPKNYKDWTPDQEKQSDDYHEKRWEMFHQITRKHGWG